MESRGSLRLSTILHAGEGGFQKKKSEKSIRSSGIHVMSLTHIEFTRNNVGAKAHDRVWFPLCNSRFTESCQCFNASFSHHKVFQSVADFHIVLSLLLLFVFVCSLSRLLCHILINTSQLSDGGSFPYYWIYSWRFTHEYKKQMIQHTQKYDNFRIYEGYY